MSARRNPYGDKDNADAKAVAADVVALGARKVTDGEGLVWSVKVAANGVATISRTTGTGKKKKTVSATAVVTVDDLGGGALRAEARFLVGGKFVMVDW